MFKKNKKIVDTRGVIWDIARTHRTKKHKHMRTKTLLLTAALSAAGLATSLAQPVYSVNAVGYVNLTLPSGKFSLIANPLNGSNNLITTVLPSLPDANTGTQLSFWDPGTQNFDPCQPIWAGAAGWIDCNGNNTNVISPGVGFFIQVVGPDLNLTFVGEVPQGHLVNPLSTTPNSYSFTASIVPQSGPVDTALGFPRHDNDGVQTFNNTAAGVGKYNDAVFFINDAVGWSYPDGSVSADGPVIGVGQGFVFQNISGAAPAAWTRDFSVN
jgi:hypothetical protein